MEKYKGITEVDILKYQVKDFCSVEVHSICGRVDISMVVTVMSLIKVNVLAGVTRVTSTFPAIQHASLLPDLSLALATNIPELQSLKRRPGPAEFQAQCVLEVSLR